MDGLSVVASVTGILSAAAKVTVMVAKFIEKERDAPHSMRKVSAEVADLSNCLTQLSPFIQNNENVPTARKAAISVEHIIAINTSCVLTLSELEEVLDSFQLDQPMAAGNRLRWAWHQEKIESILVRLRASKSSLNLILTIFTCTTLSEIQSSISNLNTSVQGILANSEDMPRRMSRIETRIARLSRYATVKSGKPTETSDDASTIHPTSYGIEDDIWSSPCVSQAMSQFGIRIQNELEASRVYRRAAERHSVSSYLSGLHSAAGSALSGVSLADISNLSVLSLPVSYGELWNPQHYTIECEPHDPADSSNTRTLHPHKTPGVAIGAAREGPGDTWTVGVDVNRINSPSLSQNSSNAEISGVRDAAAKHKAADSTTISHIRHFETPVRTACMSPADQPRATFEKVDSEVATRPQINFILLGEWFPGYDARVWPEEIGLTPVILGSRRSGKSTVLKQMKMRWSGSLCDIGERKKMRQSRISYMVLTFKVVIGNLDHAGIGYQHKDSLQHAQFLKLAADMGFAQIMPLTCLFAMERLWADEVVKTAFSRGKQYGLYDSLEYDIQNIDRYWSKAYTPSDADILHCSTPTFETTEISYRVNDLQYHVFDVGIRPGERMKVINHFAMASGSHCMIYTVPLSCYDRCSIFEKPINIIQESLQFAALFFAKLSKGTTVILLFTHLDLFEAEIRRTPFKYHFPDYTGKPDDSIAIMNFVAQKFHAVRNGMTISRIFFANVTNTKEFSAVLSQIEDLMETRCREE